MVGQFLATLGQVGRCCVRAIVVNPHARVATAAGRGLPALPADFFVIELCYYFPVDFSARKKRSRPVPQWVLERLPAQIPSPPDTVRGIAARNAPFGVRNKSNFLIQRSKIQPRRGPNFNRFPMS